MAWYPFDTQLCSMDLEMEENDKIFVDLLSGSINYGGPKDLALYYIKKKSIKNQGPTVRAEILLVRRLLSTVLTVYVPTFLLNVIALATNYFKVNSIKLWVLIAPYIIFQDFFFEAVVTVNLTAMLVLTTMFISGMFC